MSALARFRTYRAAITAHGVRPVTFGEWALGRLAGHLLTRAATLAHGRGDYAGLNHALLVTWAGNRMTDRHHLVTALPPSELNAALRENRARIIIEPAPSTVPVR